MTVMRKTRFLSFLFVAALFVQNASATILPISSYADGHWQGRRFYDYEVVDDTFLRGRIDFAVYDTDNLLFEGERELADELALPGRYIYAYQIFNDYPNSDEAVAYFTVFALDGNPMDVYEDIGSEEDDPDSGIEPTGTYFTELNLQAVWLFAGEVLMRDEHSWFLVFSSDSSPVPGDYEISAESGKFPAVPEPGMLTLLGIGGAVMFIRQRRSAQRHRLSLHNS